MTKTPALGSTCALCEWKRTCKEQCVQGRCLSLIPELGRAKKEALTGFFATIDDLAAAELSELVDGKGKTGIPGIGPPTLEKFIRRAKFAVGILVLYPTRDTGLAVRSEHPDPLSFRHAPLVVIPKVDRQALVPLLEI